MIHLIPISWQIKTSLVSCNPISKRDWAISNTQGWTNLLQFTRLLLSHPWVMWCIAVIKVKATVRFNYRSELRDVSEETRETVRQPNQNQKTRRPNLERQRDIQMGITVLTKYAKTRYPVWECQRFKNNVV